MYVKAIYSKRIEIVDEISKEEVERIPIHGMPDRFDIQADEMDNTKPLDFIMYERVKDEYYHDIKFERELRREEKREKMKNAIYNLTIAFFISLLFSICVSIYRDSIRMGIFNFIACLPISFIVMTCADKLRDISTFMKEYRKEHDYEKSQNYR